MHEEIILDGIRNLRKANNDNWMEIVRIALKYAPEETKAVMRRISLIDRDVIDRWQELSS